MRNRLISDHHQEKVPPGQVNSQQGWISCKPPIIISHKKKKSWKVMLVGKHFPAKIGKIARVDDSSGPGWCGIHAGMLRLCIPGMDDGG